MTIDARHPLPGRRPLVVGAARSGRAAARLLAGHGLDVRVADARLAGAEGAALGAELLAKGVCASFDADDPRALEGRDFVVWSPGIPVTHPVARAAAAAGIPVLSELEIGYLAARAPFLCVTGTNGKSTTTHLAGALLRGAGRQVEVCGNIGRALCEVAETVPPTGLLVVEVSSFQLETVDRLKPFVATWLNLTPDHLDRHGDFGGYGEAKQRLFARQDETDYAVWNADDPEVMARRSGVADWLEFSLRGPVPEGAAVADGRIRLGWRGGVEDVIDVREIRLRGRHNLANALAAVTTVMPLEPQPDALRAVLREYPGLEHRLEPVATVGGVAFVNDSKATNTASLEVALASFDEPVVLIAGGRDKGQDFRPLLPLVRERTRAVVLIGEGAGRLASHWEGAAIRRAGSLAEAVDRAFDEARGADRPVPVLLSPGCASFDMFRDFEDRGRAFKAEVARLAAREGAA